MCFLPWLIVDDKLVRADKHKIRRNENRLNQERLTTPNILISAKTSSNLSNFSSTSHKIFKTSKSHYMEKLWYFHFVWIPDFKGSLKSSVIIAIFFSSFLQFLILQTDMSNHFHNNPQKIFYFQFLPINHSVFTHQTESPQEIWKILLSQKIHNLWRLRALTLKGIKVFLQGFVFYGILWSCGCVFLKFWQLINFHLLVCHQQQLKLCYGFNVVQCLSSILESETIFTNLDKLESEKMFKV